MTIQKYEDWMRSQVVALFNLEYKTAEQEFDELFGLFYELPFQVNNCIRIVSVEGDRIAGFQSFFYWPVMVNGRLVKSYQSGNSLVHPDFRGQGLFGKMLNFIHEPSSGFNCELLIGFPVEASYNSFIRNKWLNPFNLNWYVKPLNPLMSLVSKPDMQLNRKWPERSSLTFDADSGICHVAQSADFDRYRFKYEKGHFYRFNWEKDGKKAFFELKAQVRKKVIHELVIGKFLSSHRDETFILEAFGALIKAVRKASNFTMLSCALNDKDPLLLNTMNKCGFRRIEKSIYFIAKGPVADEIQDWSNWWIFRSDIDTW
jgi:GNAT superfamily N-acetyltransferase